jgi:hypothetical protein
MQKECLCGWGMIRKGTLLTGHSCSQCPLSLWGQNEWSLLFCSSCRESCELCSRECSWQHSLWELPMGWAKETGHTQRQPICPNFLSASFQTPTSTTKPKTMLKSWIKGLKYYQGRTTLWNTTQRSTLNFEKEFKGGRNSHNLLLMFLKMELHQCVLWDSV